MKSAYTKLTLILFILAVILQLNGCGETVAAVGKDWRRVGKGVKTIFIRDAE